MAESTAIIGIDGGGTSTKAIAVDSNGSLIGSGTAGPSNPNNTSYEAAASNILAAIDNALSSPNTQNPTPITSLCLGIAGVATKAQRDLLKTALLNQRPSLSTTTLTITHDLEIAHQAIYGDKPGTILIAGTGSAIYSRNARGEIHRISGRSYKHHEDPGSGYAIGKCAIDTNLLPPPGTPSPSSAPHHSAAPLRAATAALAQQVIQLAEDGIQVALQILISEANHLAKFTGSISPELPITMVGGIIELDTIYKKLVQEALAPRFTIHSPTSKLRSELGALQIAWKQASKEPLPQFSIPNS